MQAEMLASEPQVDGKYFVAGMVEHPGSYSFHVPTTVLGALSLAGRFKDDVSQEKIVLMRGDRKLDFSYSALIKPKF
jgi:protein involved in polysaccharide export with SLBB domain